MTTPTIQQLLKYADLQMAAEAFLANENGSLKGSLIPVLIDGNFHASRFTPTQADAFLKEWDVVTQLPTTTTGFSGTLFRNAGGEYVISFRSTEFIDDHARDSTATNDLEIRQTGYAWGQMRERAQGRVRTVERAPRRRAAKDVCPSWDDCPRLR